MTTQDTLTSAYRRHLLQHGDHRFSQEQRLPFLLASQAMLQSCAQSARAKVRDDNPAVQALTTLSSLLPSHPRTRPPSSSFACACCPGIAAPTTGRASWSSASRTTPRASRPCTGMRPQRASTTASLWKRFCRSSPEVMQAAVDNPDLVRRICAILDSYKVCWLPNDAFSATITEEGAGRRGDHTAG